MKAVWIWILLGGLALGETREVERPEGEKPAEESAAAEVENVTELPRLELAGGKVYEKLTSIKVTPSRIRFMHEAGAASVLLAELPEDVRKLFPYDAEAAEKWEAAKREAERKQDQEVATVHGARKEKSEAMKRAGYVGSGEYWKCPPNVRNVHDKSATLGLLDAGFSPERAKKIVFDLRNRNRPN